MIWLCCAAQASVDALAYCDEEHKEPKNGFYAVRAKVPDSFKGQVIHISRLTDAHSYINSIGLVVPEMTSTVDQDGFITFPMNPQSNCARPGVAAYDSPLSIFIRHGAPKLAAHRYADR